MKHATHSAVRRGTSEMLHASPAGSRPSCTGSSPSARPQPPARPPAPPRSLGAVVQRLADVAHLDVLLLHGAQQRHARRQLRLRSGAGAGPRVPGMTGQKMAGGVLRGGARCVEAAVAGGSELDSSHVVS